MSQQDQPDSAPSASSAPTNDELYWLRLANIEAHPFQDGQSDERLSAPSAPSHGTSMWPGRVQWDYSSSTPDLPHRKISNFPLNFGTSQHQFQRGNASQPLGTLKYPYIGQPQTTHPFPATNISLHDWQQSASLPQDSLGPHPQSQARVKSRTLGVPRHASTLLGQPPVAATMTLRREAIDKSGSQVTSLPPR